MKRYQGILIWWSPIILAVVVCAGLFWHFKPDLSRISVPTVSPVYREVPRVSPEKIRYVPVGPVRMEALTGSSGRGTASRKEVLKIEHTYELKAILKLGSRRLCKFGDLFLREGDNLGPFIIKRIGDSYVEIQARGKSLRVLLGEKLIF